MVKIKEEKKLMSKEELAKDYLPDMSSQAYENIDTSGNVYTPDEATAKAIQELTSTQNIEAMSHFNDNEIKQLSVMRAFASQYGIDMIEKYIESFGKYRISLHRKGRGEIVDVSKDKRGGIFPMSMGKLNRI